MRLASVTRVHHLVGMSEIADMLGVSRQRCHQLRKEKGFPEPVVRLSMGWVWEREAIEAWALKSGRREVDEP